jgi:hypothetical protein
MPMPRNLRDYWKIARFPRKPQLGLPSRVLAVPGRHLLVMPLRSGFETPTPATTAALGEANKAAGNNVAARRPDSFHCRPSKHDLAGEPRIMYSGHAPDVDIRPSAENPTRSAAGASASHVIQVALSLMRQDRQHPARYPGPDEASLHPMDASATSWPTTRATAQTRGHSTAPSRSNAASRLRLQNSYYPAPPPPIHARKSQRLPQLHPPTNPSSAISIDLREKAAGTRARSSRFGRPATQVSVSARSPAVFHASALLDVRCWSFPPRAGNGRQGGGPASADGAGT